MAKLHDVANFFINKSHEEGIPITHLKLQKLCYYAQAWHLVLSKKNTPLFRGEFQAWVHGPVNPELFKTYRQYGWDPIMKKPEEINLDRSEEEILNEVWQAYGSFDAKYLEALTHNEKPWKKARKGLPEDAYSTEVIDEDEMLKYYSSLR
ncbi:type II toxin-antitoxin system antitoxin SocA domain-containing protein [Paenibacillus cisolokensis]|uniref:Panacea domain-containing protein n=1 Tax=Paenibacillus cisolokensis TaxID=1658519 RepID=UPI003D288401